VGARNNSDDQGPDQEAGGEDDGRDDVGEPQGATPIVCRIEHASGPTSMALCCYFFISFVQRSWDDDAGSLL
jgi:hypothetical protein